MKKQKTIGVEVEFPKEKCDDKNCPFHGTLKLHGKIFRGKVISAKKHKTITIEWERLFHIPKYERYEKRKTKIKAHVPPCIKVKENFGKTCRSTIRKRVLNAFDESTYHQRSKVETIFSSIKRKYNSCLKARTFSSQKKEVLCKLIAYNIDRLINFYLSFLRVSSEPNNKQ